MKQQFSGIVTPRKGIRFTSSLSDEENRYRLQNRKEINKAWTNGLRIALKPNVIWNTEYSDTKVFSRIISLSEGLQDLTVNTRNGKSRIKYVERFSDDFSCNARAVSVLSRDETNVLIERNLKGEVGGGVVYRYGDLAKFKGRGAYGSSSQRSESRFQTFTGLGEHGDSLASQLVITLPQDAEIKVDYMRATNSKKYMDLPRGLYQEQKIEEKDLVRETKTSNSNDLSIGAVTHPLGGVELKMAAEHSVDLNEYAIARKRDTKDVLDRVTGDVTYTYGTDRRVTFNAVRSELLKDFGPVSVSSYEQKEKRTTIAVNHRFTPTLTVAAQASAGLTQIYYVDFDVNPRDRDQLDQSMQLRLTSKPYKKIVADIFMSLSSTEFRNIDQSLSKDNRKDTTYDLRPSITFKLNDRIEIAQDYGLNIEFTDYVFTENENYLDRNVTFGNTFKTRLSRRISTEFYYGLLFHDRGSYLRQNPDEERRLGIQQEDRKDQTRVTLRYMLNRHMTVFVQHEYSQRWDKNVGSGAIRTVSDGIIQGGLEGKYRWGDDSALTFSLLKVNRYGLYNSRAQNDYWLARSNLQYAF